MIVGFTGTQNGLTLAQRTALRTFLETLKDVEEFHHGDCIGADATAHHIMVPRVPVVLHPSDRKDKRAFCKGAAYVWAPKPPLDRNIDIIKASDLMVACPKQMFEELRSGTWTTVRDSDRLHKTITIVWPDGRVQPNVDLNKLGA